jgi:hypothetical protein
MADRPSQGTDRPSQQGTNPPDAPKEGPGAAPKEPSQKTSPKETGTNKIQLWRECTRTPSVRKATLEAPSEEWESGINRNHQNALAAKPIGVRESLPSQTHDEAAERTHQNALFAKPTSGSGARGMGGQGDGGPGGWGARGMGAGALHARSPPPEDTTRGRNH